MMKTLTIVLAFLLFCPVSLADSRLPYQNPNLSDEERVDDLIARMTLVEKIGQMSQYVGIEHIRKSEKNMTLDLVLELEVDQSALVDRIVKRAAEAKANGQPVRKDDDPEVFKQRLEAYNRDTAVVAPYYRGRGQLKTVDGMKSIDEVSAQIDSVLDAVGREV